MRTVRRLVMALTLLSLVSPAASAQIGRSFKDSWFWGVKSGSVALWTTETRGYAPMIGVETLITRTRGGLYISYDMSLLGEMRHSEFATKIDDPLFGELLVELGDLQRLTAMAIGFPTRGPLRPYFGIGMAINYITHATPLDPNLSPAQREAIERNVEQLRSRAAPILMGGIQLELLRLSLFGQGSYMPAQSDFLFNNNETYFLEAGLRYNIGSSIDQIR